MIKALNALGDIEKSIIGHFKRVILALVLVLTMLYLLPLFVLVLIIGIGYLLIFQE